MAWHELPPLLVWANLLTSLPAAKTQSCEYTITPAWVSHGLPIDTARRGDPHLVGTAERPRSRL